jgi:hypothetical protein
VTKIRGGVLKTLGWIYGLGGQSAQLDEIALGIPIQPVHDMSRMSELGSGIGANDGFWTVVFGMQNSTRTNKSVDLSTIFQSFGLDETTLSTWVVGVAGRANSANITDVSLTVDNRLIMEYDDLGAVTRPVTAQILTKWTASTVMHFDAAGGMAYGLTGTVDGMLPVPVYCPPGSTLRASSLFTTATTQAHTFLMWSGAKGTHPPGYG